MANALGGRASQGDSTHPSASRAARGVISIIVNSKRARPTRAFYIVAAVVFVPSVVTVVLASEGSVAAAGVGLCSAIGWFVLARWVRRGESR